MYNLTRYIYFQNTFKFAKTTEIYRFLKYLVFSVCKPEESEPRVENLSFPCDWKLLSYCFIIILIYLSVFPTTKNGRPSVEDNNKKIE